MLATSSGRTRRDRRYLLIGVVAVLLAAVIGFQLVPRLLEGIGSTTQLGADVNTLSLNENGVCGEWRVKPRPSAGFMADKVNITSVDALSGQDLWLVGEVYGPRDWDDKQSHDQLAVHVAGSTSRAYKIPDPLGTSFPTVDMVASDDVWASGPDTSPGSAPQLARWDGSDWEIIPVQLPALAASLVSTASTYFDLAALPSGDVWVAGTLYPPGGGVAGRQNVVLRRSGGAWQQIPAPDVAGTGRILAIDANDVWIDGYGSMLHWDGQQFTKVPLPSASMRVRDMDASAGDDVWAVGDEPGSHEGSSVVAILHWDGKEWSRVPVPSVPLPAGFINAFRFELRGVAAISKDDAWAVGYLLGTTDDWYRQRTIALHWNGSEWAIVSSPNFDASQSFSDIVAVSPQELWAVGQVGPDIDEKNILLAQLTLSPCKSSDLQVGIR